MTSKKLQTSSRSLGACVQSSLPLGVLGWENLWSVAQRIIEWFCFGLISLVYLSIQWLFQEEGKQAG